MPTSNAAPSPAPKGSTRPGRPVAKARALLHRLAVAVLTAPGPARWT